MANYDFLRASNGSGDAALMHITADRLAAATTIKVDSVTNVPTKFIASYGTLAASGFIDPTTKRDFRGHVSGSDLIIDAFEPGNTDAGSVEGQVVVIRPATGWANRVANFIESLTGIIAVETATQTAIAASIMPLVYPIGSIYTATVSTNPATLLGFGTWTAFGAGRVVVGVGTSDQAFSAGATGGESNHTLTTAEIPAHTHDTQGNTHVLLGGSSSPYDTVSGTVQTGSTGGGGSHNNLQPYVVAYMWRRTA